MTGIQSSTANPICNVAMCREELARLIVQVIGRNTARIASKDTTLMFTPIRTILRITSARIMYRLPGPLPLVPNKSSNHLHHCKLGQTAPHLWICYIYVTEQAPSQSYVQSMSHVLSA